VAQERGLPAVLAARGRSNTAAHNRPPENHQAVKTVFSSLIATQTASTFSFRWWGANPTLSDRHQLDDLPGLHSAQHEALDVSEPRYANSRDDTDLVRSASFPTGVNGILARFERREEGEGMVFSSGGDEARPDRPDPTLN
jgi:hypothetical protein